MPEKRFVFAVQGEGRGHLTQAIALFRILQEQGHTVSCVIVGGDAKRELPDFFRKKINAPIIRVESMNFSMNPSQKSVNQAKSLLFNLIRLRTFHKSLRIIRDLIDEYNPHVVINLYEPLMALYTLCYPRSFRIISIAHQNIYLHREFRFPGGFRGQALLLKYYTRFLTLGSERILALSMYPLSRSHDRRLIVCPPILRHELFDKTASDEGFLLIYLFSSGFMKDIISWHRKNPDVRLAVFTDNRDVKERHKGVYRVDENLCFHSLSDEKFLDMMSKCTALVCTAGFESVCEAMYLGKRIMMVPLQGQFEQYCNARDTERIGAGIFAGNFNLDELYRKSTDAFPFAEYRQWVNSFTSVLSQAINEMDPSANSVSDELFRLPGSTLSVNNP
jgi:uncharacterized protein (TIGR00661 family)